MPDGEDRQRTETTDVHDKDAQQFGSGAQLRRDSGGESDGTERTHGLKEKIGERNLRF